jgi:hypothetical protein
MNLIAFNTSNNIHFLNLLTKCMTKRFFFYQLGFKLVLKIMQRDLRGRNLIVVAIYNYICNQRLSPLKL